MENGMIKFEIIFRWSFRKVEWRRVYIWGDYGLDFF